MGLKNVVNDSVSHLDGSVTVIILGRYMQDELRADLTKADGLNFIGINSSFHVGSLQVIHCLVGDQQSSLLFLFVVIEFEDWAAHVNNL